MGNMKSPKAPAPDQLPMAKAYAYIRLSSQAQAAGDGERRQRESAQLFAARGSRADCSLVRLRTPSGTENMRNGRGSRARPHSGSRPRSRKMPRTTPSSSERPSGPRLEAISLIWSRSICVCLMLHSGYTETMTFQSLMKSLREKYVKYNPLKSAKSNTEITEIVSIIVRSREIYLYRVKPDCFIQLRNSKLHLFYKIGHNMHAENPHATTISIQYSMLHSRHGY